MNNEDNVVSLEAFRIAHTKYAILEFEDDGKDIIIKSSNGRDELMNEHYANGPTMEEFEAMIRFFKANNPHITCIDF